ncbi:hypothetical protein TWF718_003749 [Orbilia javanica]|uniref:Serine protease inhibitor n=1 Tax=Orbilia javanica TaxID=47235 RepID=A0AAN8RK69_9PEZI
MEPEGSEQVQNMLTSGSYTIVSAKDNLPIGRRANEDKSLHPKRVYALPPEEAGQNSVWQLEFRGDSSYILKCNGAPTVAHESHVWAVLTDDEEPTVWKVIKRGPGSGGGYTIVNKNDPIGAGWVVSILEAHDDKPIAVRPLIVFPTFPATYPNTELFVFKEIKEEDQ